MFPMNWLILFLMFLMALIFMKSFLFFTFCTLKNSTAELYPPTKTLTSPWLW